MATQKTIAKALGISQPSVSAVLGKHSEKSKTAVSPEMRNLILTKAKELGYRPNIFAQALNGVRTKTIGLVHYDPAFANHIDQKTIIAREVYQYGYRLNTLNATAINIAAPETMSHIIDQLIDMRVDGVIFSFVPGYMSIEEVKRLSSHNIPIVSIRGTMFPGVPYFGMDIDQTFALLTKHLLHLGYRRLFLIRQAPTFSSNVPIILTEHPKIKAFEEAIKRAGGSVVDLGIRDLSTPPPELPKTNSRAPVGYFGFFHPANDASRTRYSPFEIGRQQLDYCLDMGFQMDAYLFSSDDHALGAISAALRRNIRVPEDIGITGMDGTQMGQYHTPAFTSMELPTEVIASRGTKYLLKLIEKKQKQEASSLSEEQFMELYPCRLLVGGTTSLRSGAGA